MILDFEGKLSLKRVYGLNNTLNFEGTKNKREMWLIMHQEKGRYE
jgi:hypothetical protein